MYYTLQYIKSNYFSCLTSLTTFYNAWSSFIWSNCVKYLSWKMVHMWCVDVVPTLFEHSHTFSFNCVFSQLLVLKKLQKPYKANMQKPKKAYFEWMFAQFTFELIYFRESRQKYVTKNPFHCSKAAWLFSISTKKHLYTWSAYAMLIRTC